MYGSINTVTHLPIETIMIVESDNRAILVFSKQIGNSVRICSALDYMLEGTDILEFMSEHLLEVWIRT